MDTRKETLELMGCGHMAKLLMFSRVFEAGKCTSDYQTFGRSGELPLDLIVLAEIVTK